jgi:hypothetical protein
MSNTPIGNLKPIIDLNKLSDSVKEVFGNTTSVVSSAGIGGDNISELSPIFNKISTEVVYKGPHDSYIVLGRDRAGSYNIDDGYGLKGHTGASAIDLVVGRKAADDTYDYVNSKANPDFATDAARVYISQKSDIDKNLSIPAGVSGLSEGRSAVGVKADSVRLVARENLKLVVGTDSKNARQGNINTKIGIELMAGDLDKCSEVLIIEDTAELQILEIEKGGMQPIPLGINTAFALDQLTEKVDKLSSVVSTAAVILTDYMNEMGSHTHRNLVNEYFGLPVLPSEQSVYACNETAIQLTQFVIHSIELFRKELVSYKSNHLKPSGPYYINSKFHSLN